MQEQVITTGLKQLRLNYLVDNLDQFLEGCSNSTPLSIIERLVNLELVEKSSRGIKRRIHQAKLGRFKHISDFDWAWPKAIDRDRVEKSLGCEFIDAKRNIVLAGAQGLGKTMLAKNIGNEAAIKGKTVLFTTASNLVMNLKTYNSQSDLNKALRKYTAPDLLILDELGYLSYNCQSADLIFEVVNRRYETGSIVISTNLAFKDWSQIFPGAACLTAMIDRLTHHADVFKFEGQSFRLGEAAKK